MAREDLGKPAGFDCKKAVAELNNMSEKEFRRVAASSGAFDIIEILPAGEKKYESAEEPGFIEAIRSLDHRGYYHPRDKEGFPIFDVLLDKNGSIVKK